jgi:hypothetical protein
MGSCSEHYYLGGMGIDDLTILNSLTILNWRSMVCVGASRGEVQGCGGWCEGNLRGLGKVGGGL